jgi:hypothetical protein
MDIEARARRQSRRIIISEALMVLTVIATVSILAFIVSGYWVGSDFKIERQGLIQIYSIPTGADIEVDDAPSNWLQRTNTSKTLSAGEHTIKLSKEGYDTWSRTVNIAEGLLYRLHYPRLFLNNRYVETAFESSANFATVSPDRNAMLLANNTTSWQLLNLDTDNIKPVDLDLSKVLPFTSRADNASIGLFSGTIKAAEWASDNEHVLLTLVQEGTTNWVLINVKNPANSVNLTKDFNADFSEIKILDQSASNLLVVLAGNLHRIDVPAKQISAVILPKVRDFDFYEQTIVFSAKDTETSKYYIGLSRLGSNEVKRLEDDLDAAKEVLITKFYDDEYIGVISDDNIVLHTKNNYETKATYNISFKPEKNKVGNSGEAIIMYTGGNIATVDMEASDMFEWSTDTDQFGWLDGSMIYAVKDGTLHVYDFNGLNHRTLSTNVSSHFPVTITADKYLYYFRDGSLIREYLYEK